METQKGIERRSEVGAELNWREVWERKHEERVEASLKGKLKPEDWGKVAKGYSDWNKSNDYEYGRKAVEVIKGMIAPDFEVLDIGAGPGTLAIPFAEKVRKVTAVEPSKGMIECLIKDVEERGIRNIEVINKNWQEVGDADIKQRFDIVVCSHLLWQFKDVDRQLRRMEDASRGHCCVVHPAGGRDIIIQHLWPEIMGREYSGELDPALDDLLFVMLRERGILVNVRVIDFITRLSVEQEERLIISLLSQHSEITPALREVIKSRVLERLSNGMYEEKSHAAVVWWKTPLL